MRKYRVILSFFAIVVLLGTLSACHISTWLTYTNATYGFQLQYPAGGSVVTDTPTGARIQLPITPGTNLVEKYLDISVEAGAIPCLSPYGEPYGPPPGAATVTGTQTINGNYWTLESAGEGAAGSYYEWTAYSTYGYSIGGEVCVSLTFVLHSHNPMVYETPPPIFDKPVESLVFPMIVDTFTWLDSTPVPAGGWLTYTNLAYGFQLRYPPGGGGLQPGDTAIDARIQLPFTPGTSLMEKYLAIEVRTDSSPCSASLGPGSPTPVPLIINGLEWIREPGAEGAAGSVFVWTTYSTQSGSVCIHLIFDLHSESPVVEPTPVPDYDMAAESAVFEQIVETFIWLNGAAVTPTWVPTFTPTPVPFSFIPNINAYCRLGPDPIFNSITLAMRGQSYPINGRNLRNTWLYIMVTPAVGCWVPADQGTPSGDTSLVRVLNDIPTPTFTPIPQGPNCAQYTNRQSCNAVAACTWTQLTDKTGLCTNK